MISIYMNYFANENQKSIIDEILKHNTIEEEKEKEQKYSVDKIFEERASTENNNLPVEVNEKNDNFIKKIINKIKSIFSTK